MRHVDEREHFSLTDLADRLGSQGRKIGLIIDLTDTDRYYDYRVRCERAMSSGIVYSVLQDVEEMGIAYCKIRIPGQQGVPEQCCQRFFHVVNSFLRDNQHNGDECDAREAPSNLFSCRQTDRRTLHARCEPKRLPRCQVDLLLFRRCELLARGSSRYLIGMLGLPPNDAIAGRCAFRLRTLGRRRSFQLSIVHAAIRWRSISKICNGGNRRRKRTFARVTRAS